MFTLRFDYRVQYSLLHPHNYHMRPIVSAAADATISQLPQNSTVAATPSVERKQLSSLTMAFAGGTIAFDGSCTSDGQCIDDCQGHVSPTKGRPQPALRHRQPLPYLYG
jgi:hypothetical protein